jgi:RHS repeat-associated protein
MTNVSRLLLCIALAFLLGSVPAGAQCNPSYDPDCGGGDSLGPDVGFNPDGGSYAVAAGGSQSVAVTITFSDPDGLRQDTLKITVKHGTVTRNITGFTWTPTSNNTFAAARGTIVFTGAGEHELRAEIADLTGRVGFRTTKFTLTYPDPNAPVVSLAPHHNDFRDTSLGESVLTYSIPSYTSLDQQRAFGLYYDSERADPTGFVQLDVDTSASTSVQAITLHIVDAATNDGVTSEDAWGRDPSGKQRVGAQWSMRERPTGVYSFYADVRTYQNGVAVGHVRTPFRVLVVNDRLSRYGIGWSIAVQRAYASSAGLLVTEGNGVARWFEKVSCVTGVSCSYRTPAGDFSKMEYIQSIPAYVRTYIDGSKVTFSTAGVMTSVADRFGRTTKYDWVLVDSPPVWLLAKITDPAGINTWFEYYDGNLKAVIDPSARRIEMSYGGGLTRIAGPSTLEAQYDSLGRATSFTDARGTWDIAYDDRGTVRQVTAPAVTVAGGASVRPTTTFRSLQAVTVLGSWVTHICCNWAAPVPANAVFTTVTDPLGHVTKIMPNRYGEAAKVIDVAGRTTVTTYNDQGLPTSSNDGAYFADFTWNTRGQLLSKTINMAVVYHASYTTGDQPESEMSGGRTTWYTYGSRGEVLRSWFGTSEDATRNGTTYEYDANYRLVATVGPRGERTEYSYAGNPWLNTSEVRVVRSDGTRLVTAFTYDGAGRQHKVTNPLGQTTTTSYDTLNRAIKVVDPLQRPTLFGYTGFDLTSVTDAAGKVHRYTVNAIGWVTQETFPDGKIRRYAYDADGKRTSTTDRRNATITVAYDTGHRVTSRTADGITTTFTYPDDNTIVMANEETTETIRMHAEAAGRLHKATFTLGGPSSSVAYEVERLLDRMNGWSLFGVDVKRLQGGAPIGTESIRFTTDNRPVDTTFGSILAVRDFANNVTTLGFDSAGQLTRTDFPNGVKQNHWYASDGRLTGTTYSSGTVNFFLAAGYTYDLLNRVATRSGDDDKTRWSYGYNAMGQVAEYQRAELKPVEWCNPSVETCDEMWTVTRMASYTYDAAGNRTDSGASLQASSNRYATFNGFTLEYDAEGNLTRKFKAGYEQRMTWNTLRRLTSVTTNGVTTTYGYAPTGRRIRRTENGQSSYYIYDDDDLIMEVDGQGSVIRAYTHLPGTDLPLSVRTGSGAQYYTMEAPGHVNGVLNASGGVAAQYRYEPFGASESTSDTTGQPLRFMARELDGRSGFYYVRNRWYDPALARFVSEDPIGLAGGINSYAYVENDPLNRRDPSGLAKWVCFMDFDDFVFDALVCFYDYNFGEAFGDSDRTYGLTRGLTLGGIVTGTASYGHLYPPPLRRGNKPLTPLPGPDPEPVRPSDCFVNSVAGPELGTLAVSGEAGFLPYPDIYGAFSGRRSVLDLYPSLSAGASSFGTLQPCGR